jgi:hypothetical protein
MRLAVVSVEGPDIERLQQLLDQVRGQLTRPWLWAASEAEADVLVIDVDSLYGHMDWLRAHGQGRRVICLTGRPGSEHDVTLTRPITAQGLLQDLRHFEAQARSQAAAAAAPPQADPIPAPQADPAPAPEDAKASEPVDPTLAAPAVVPPDPPPPAVEASRPAGTATQYRLTPRASPIVKARPQIVVEDHPAAPDPDRLTLADFCAIAALPEPAKLDRADAPTLVIDAERDCYYCSSPTLKPLLAYCNGTIARSEWQPVPVAEIEALRSNALVIHPLARLIWLHTLINSHGHLLAGLDYNARYRLTRWPQIEREFPKHFRIATVMMKGPVSLTEVADQAGATIPDVVDFVDAYTALGVVEPEGAAAPAALAAASGESGGLLARLRGLRRG